jgi:hypothetical protein
MAAPTQPASTTDSGSKHTVAYGANDIDSLKTLELSCERDEAHLLANIKEVRLALDDDIKVTAVIYEDVDNFDMGHLTFVEYKTDVDLQSQIAIHKALGAPIKGQAYVKGQAIKVLVFRDSSAAPKASSKEPSKIPK